MQCYKQDQKYNLLQKLLTKVQLPITSPDYILFQYKMFALDWLNMIMGDLRILALLIIYVEDHVMLHDIPSLCFLVASCDLLEFFIVLLPTAAAELDTFLVC